MKINSILFAVLIHITLLPLCFCDDISIPPIAVAEGPAEGNAIDVMAQIGKSGFVIITASEKMDISSDLVESSYDPAYHMPEISLPAGKMSTFSNNLNREQAIVKFAVSDGIISALLPRTDPTTEKVQAILHIPLKIAAGSTIDLNDANGLAVLKSSLFTIIKLPLPSITDITLYLWPKGDSYYYFRAANHPHIPIIHLDPDSSLYDIIVKSCIDIHGLIWIIQAIDNHINISLTTVQTMRSSRPLPAIVMDLKVSHDDLGDYPSKNSRIHDVSRELARRLILEPAETREAIITSGAIHELVTDLAKNSDSTFVPLYFLMCYRNKELSELIISEVNKAPKDISDKFYYSILPGINGHGPAWKELYVPVWKGLLKNSDPDIVKRAQSMLIEH